jgi:hypothetical protein
LAGATISGFLLVDRFFGINLIGSGIDVIFFWAKIFKIITSVLAFATQKVGWIELYFNSKIIDTLIRTSTQPEDVSEFCRTICRTVFSVAKKEMLSGSDFIFKMHYLGTRDSENAFQTTKPASRVVRSVGLRQADGDMYSICDAIGQF